MKQQNPINLFKGFKMFFWQNDKYAEEDFPGSKNNPCAFESPWNVDTKNNLRITVLPWLERPQYY